jgi:hypothetical protein
MSIVWFVDDPTYITGKTPDDPVMFHFKYYTGKEYEVEFDHCGNSMVKTADGSKTDHDVYKVILNDMRHDIRMYKNFIEHNFKRLAECRTEYISKEKSEDPEWDLSEILWYVDNLIEDHKRLENLERILDIFTKEINCTTGIGDPRMIWNYDPTKNVWKTSPDEGTELVFDYEDGGKLTVRLHHGVIGLDSEAEDFD